MPQIKTTLGQALSAFSALGSLKTTDFERFSITMTLEQALSASHPGPCDAEVAALLQDQFIIDQLAEIGWRKIADELREYGAWDDSELADCSANRARIVWLAAGNIREEQQSGERA